MSNYTPTNVPNDSIFKPMNVPNNSLLNYDRTVVGKAFIRKLILRESGTYNNQYTRSYQAHMTPGMLNAVVDKAGEIGTNVFKPTTLSGLAGNFISIAAAPESTDAIVIPNGWNERRMIFFMDVLVEDLTGAKTVFLVQGYTDYNGFSLASKHIDPNMVFYINNIIALRPLHGYNTPDGAGMTQSVAANDHLLYDMNSQPHPQQYLLRPNDLFGHMAAASFVNNAAKANNKPGLYDQRNKLMSAPKMSTRTNSIPTNYASKLINGYMSANNELDGHGEATTTYEHASELVGDNTPGLNPFLNAISKNTLSGAINGAFRYKDLTSLDPNLLNSSNGVVNILMQGATQMNQQHQAGQTADWQSASINTKYAAAISQAVPALMLECMLSNIEFTSNNLMNIDSSFTGIYSVITGGQTLAGDGAPHLFQAFMRRLEIEVLKDLSFNNQQKFDISVRSSFSGETWIRVSIDGGPFYDFSTPTFCDGLITPVLTTNLSNLESVVESVDMLVSTVADNINPHRPDRMQFSVPSNNTAFGNNNYQYL